MTAQGYGFVVCKAENPRSRWVGGWGGAKIEGRRMNEIWLFWHHPRSQTVPGSDRNTWSMMIWPSFTPTTRIVHTCTWQPPEEYSGRYFGLCEACNGPQVHSGYILHCVWHIFAFELCWMRWFGFESFKLFIRWYGIILIITTTTTKSFKVSIRHLRKSVTMH